MKSTLKALKFVLLIAIVSMAAVTLSTCIFSNSKQYVTSNISKNSAIDSQDGPTSAQERMEEKEENQPLGREYYPAGSSLPDCSHACGPCFPCKRVMVSFKCSVSEPCPIVYRCICRGNFYHVPSAH